MGFRKRCAEKRAQAQLSSHVAGRHERLDQPQVPARKMPKIKQVMKPAKSSALRVACVCVCESCREFCPCMWLTGALGAPRGYLGVGYRLGLV